MKAKYKLKLGLDHGQYNPALDFGSLFHGVLDTVYSQRIGHGILKRDSNLLFWEELCEQALEQWYTDTLESQELTPSQEQEFERLWGMCGTVLPYYFRRWQKDDSKLEWIAVEEIFDYTIHVSMPYLGVGGCDLVVPIRVRGKIDGLVRYNGRLYLVEHKTKAEIAEMINKNGKVSCQAITEKMGYELQVNTYALAIYEKYGEYPAGVIYNLIKRPGLIFKGTYNRKPESIPQFLARVEDDLVKKGDEYFCRYRVRLYPREIEEFRNVELNHWLTRMYMWDRGLEPSVKQSKSCSMFRKPCEYLNICAYGDTIGYTKRDTLFKELTMIED
jgi:hypothetical protein